MQENENPLSEQENNPATSPKPEETTPVQTENAGNSGAAALSEVSDEAAKKNTSGEETPAEDETQAVPDTARHESAAVRAKLEQTAAYGQDALEDELERLADVFRRELKKTAEEEVTLAAGAGTLMEQLDETEDGRKTKPEEIPEEELCKCCGERRREKVNGEVQEYCSICHEAMRHYPVGLYNYLILLVITIAAVLGIVSFSGDFKGYYDVYTARACAEENRITTAMQKYDSAISFFEGRNITAQKPYLESAILEYRLMPQGADSMQDIVSRIEKAITKTQAKFPMYASYVNLRYRVLNLYNTLEAFYDIIDQDKYADFTMTTDTMYEQMQEEVSKLSEQSMLLKPIGSTKATQSAVYDTAMVYFSHYMLAYAAKDYANSYLYILKLADAEPDFLWMYGYQLCNIFIQKSEFEKAKTLADKLTASNAEESAGYELNAYCLRKQKQYDKALESVEKGLQISTQNPELYRQQAIAYLLKGDTDKAKEAALSAQAIDQYGTLYLTEIVIGTEAKDEELVANAEEGLKTLETEKTQRIQDYLEGTLSAQQLFTEGTGEVE